MSLKQEIVESILTHGASIMETALGPSSPKGVAVAGALIRGLAKLVARWGHHDVQQLLDDLTADPADKADLSAAHQRVAAIIARRRREDVTR